MKFSSNGVNRVYATYLGRRGEMSNPIAWWWDQGGNLVIAGRTSSPDFPNVNSTGAKDVLKGGYDIIPDKIKCCRNGSDRIRIIVGLANDGGKISRQNILTILYPWVRIPSFKLWR
ncbi:MAG: hypothetical protein WDM78_10205 [Puia sp.]